MSGTMTVHGACHCGAIAFEAEVDPARVTVCHCVDCQSLTGTAYRVTVPAEADHFRLLRGAPTVYRKTTANSGNPRSMGFCGACGSQIYSCAAVDNPAWYGLRVGTLSERESLTPTRRIWGQSALPWSIDLSGVPVAERE